MNTKEKIKFISNWIGNYVKEMPVSAKSLVIGVSGGIDSSVSSTLSAMTGLKTIVLCMPIKQNKSQHDLSIKHKDWLTKNFDNVLWHEGIGEETGQKSNFFDMVTFGSSFNVCERNKALLETSRILKPNGWFACMWNHRILEDPIQSEIESIIR